MDRLRESGGSEPRTPSNPLSTTALDGIPRSKSVKRPRPVKSCLECRKRKLKCDRQKECSQCQKARRFCKYPENNAGGGSDASDGETERATKRPQYAAGPSTSDASRLSAYPGGAELAIPRSPVGMDEVAARLERLEKLITGSRIAASPIAIRGLSLKGEMGARMLGQSKVKTMLHLFGEAKDIVRNMADVDRCREVFLSLQDAYRALQRQHRKSIEAIPVFAQSTMPVEKRMADILPPRAVCDRLGESYVEVTEGLCRFIHMPSFWREYESFWGGRECRDGFLPQLLCVLCVGARFATDTRGLSHNRFTSVHIPTACALVRQWLDGLQGDQLVDITTLETELLLFHAQYTIAPSQQTSWMQLGYVVRMAMVLGLHRDPSEDLIITPFHSEYRRRLWYTVLETDLYAAQACDLPCAINEGEYSCKAPANLGDDDLAFDAKRLLEPKPLDHYTSRQLPVYAARTLPSRINAASVVSRLDSVQDYAEILDAGAALERAIDDINCLFPQFTSLDIQEKHRQWITKTFLSLQARRSLVALYRPFVFNAPNCPPQISSSFLKSSMMVLVYAEELDTPRPSHEEAMAMFRFIFRQDIIEAAFGVCYFLKNSRDSTTRAVSRESWPPTQPEGAAPAKGLDAQYPWSAAKMIDAVERTVVRLLGTVSAPSPDLRDIIALAIVVNSVRAGTAEQKLERTTDSIMRIVDICRRGVKPEGALFSPPAGVAPPSTGKQSNTPDVYSNPTSRSSLSEASVDEDQDELPFWEAFLAGSNYTSDQMSRRLS
ncbi:hypothetical protein B0T24DRAFT_337749 [Lasiosphaeria ovina]|uniref:Zn(2)-C6 fungal-type domain-containing protein n=1 Tax=Lasiosphaeria ovina TaxID=92902 RepID=A0AAE0K8F4_9PEZI|nr:hypothetical protein B0T24DRAFT_337749 [Lasiosphaeria ovina]